MMQFWLTELLKRINQERIKLRINYADRKLYQNNRLQHESKMEKPGKQSNAIIGKNKIVKTKL